MPLQAYRRHMAHAQQRAQAAGCNAGGEPGDLAGAVSAMVRTSSAQRRAQAAGRNAGGQIGALAGALPSRLVYLLLLNDLANVSLLRNAGWRFEEGTLSMHCLRTAAEEATPVALAGTTARGLKAGAGTSHWRGQRRTGLGRA
eukprot:365758-Chlamydomonas_euryale.AAC.4